MGRSSRQMQAALASGETDAAAMAHLAQGCVRDRHPVLARALAGQIGPHQRFLLARQLAHIDFLDASIAEVSAEITERRRPFAPELERLATILGGAAKGRGAAGRDRHRRLAAWRGTKRATVAVGHTILVIAYHVLREGDAYHDLRERSFDERDRQAVARRLVRCLGALGHKIILGPAT